MGDLRKHMNSQSSSDPEGQKALVPKPEILDFELPSETVPRHVGDNVASSSGSNLRSFLVGMGFLPLLVDKVIEEKGEDNVDLLLETLFEYSDVHKPDSQSSDSLDSLFDEQDTSSSPGISTLIQPKQEPDVLDEVIDDKRASLLVMNFSVFEVDFALNRLGEDAAIDEIIDFITAAQIAEKFEKEPDETSCDDEEKNEALNDITNEALFGTMDKTLRLLEMGFSEDQVSLAIEKRGPKVPISELADSIFVGPTGDCAKRENVFVHSQYSSEALKTNTAHIAKNCQSSGVGMKDDLRHCSYDILNIKTEDVNLDTLSQSRDINQEETWKGKRSKEMYGNDYPDAVSQCSLDAFKENHRGKRPRKEYVDDSSSFLDPTCVEEKVDPHVDRFGLSRAFKSSSCRSLDRMVAKPPYFFYGNVVNVSHDSWSKISQFLYTVQPEFVNTEYFSALSKKEGYVHNLPTENRLHILPKSPMTIGDAIPGTKKWWPSWDTRKQLSCISSETNGISQLCSRLGKMLIDSRGRLSSEQQRDVLYHCQTLNLVWVGPYKLGPVEPEQLEQILGYPVNHTQAANISLTERLQSLKHCFQTDTLGYHLSVLKSMFPGGLTMLSLFSGIGGAEVTLHRLGIHLKGVVSVESSEANRRILKRWWHSSGQTGELVQIGNIQNLTIKKLDSLINQFGCFDFVICQNPCIHSSYSKGSSNMAEDDDCLLNFDFSLFYECVRLIQRVRSTMEQKRGEIFPHQSVLFH